MPTALVYYPPGDVKREGYLTYNREKDERIRRYRQFWSYYEGEQKRQLDVKDNEPDDNVVINLVQMTIDRTLAFLFPGVPKFEVAPIETEETPEEIWFRELMVHNGGLPFLWGVGINGSLSGHCYVRIKPGLPYPKLINLDPEIVQTFWRADDLTEVVWHELAWAESETNYVIDFVNRGGSWEIIEYQGHSGKYDQVNHTTWASPFGPIVHWQHLPRPNRFYGRPDISSVILQDRVNLIASEVARILRYHSSPRTIAVGVSADEIVPTAIDHMWTIDNDNAVVQNLEMRSELTPAQNMLGILYDAYLSQQRVVILRGEVKDFQRVTNTGVRTVFMDSLAKNNLLRETYGRGLVNVLHRAAMVASMGELTPIISWEEPIPTDDKELVDISAIMRSMNVVSRETVATRFGLTWDDELQKMIQESKQPIFSPIMPVANTSVPGDSQETE